MKKEYTHEKNRRNHRDVGVRQHREAANEYGDFRTHSIMKVTKVPYRQLVTGTVVETDFPFREVNGESKFRSAVVVSSSHKLVEVMYLTSSQKESPNRRIPICDLLAAGLTRPTKAGVNEIETVERSKVVKVRGNLAHIDMINLGLIPQHEMAS